MSLPFAPPFFMHDTRNTRYGVHQGGLVQLKNDARWRLIMDDSGQLGRTTRQVPVTRVDGRPMIGRRNDKGDRIGVDTFRRRVRVATFVKQSG